MSDQERRATEELLAGFDRPGRSPRAPAVRLDFNPHAPATGAETVLVTRRRGSAMWPWLLAAFLVSAVAGVVGLLFLMKPKPVTAPEAPASVSAVVVVEPAPAPSVVPSSVPPAAEPPSAPARIVKPPASTKRPDEHRHDFIQSL